MAQEPDLFLQIVKDNRIGLVIGTASPPRSPSRILQKHVVESSRLAREIAESINSLRRYCEGIVAEDFRGRHYGPQEDNVEWIQFLLQNIVNHALALSEYLKGGLQERFALLYPEGGTKSIGEVSANNTHLLAVDLGLDLVAKAWSVIRRSEESHGKPFDAGSIYTFGILVAIEEEEGEHRLMFRQKHVESVAQTVLEYPRLDEGAIRGWLEWEALGVKSKLKKDPPSSSTRSATDLISYTQGDLDNAIREYKAARASTYSDIKASVARNLPGAIKHARKMFGRNAISRKLKVKSQAMVSNSTAWQAIADELGLRTFTSKGTHRDRKRIGYDIALEEQAESTSEAVIDTAIRRETIGLINKSMPKDEAEATVEELRRGKITDDAACKMVQLSIDQQRDQRSNRVLPEC